MKKCSKCQQEKAATKELFAMYRDKGVEKLRPECRECSNKMSADYKARNREAISTYNREYKATHAAETTVYNRGYFAKRREEPEFRIKSGCRSRIAGLMRGKMRDSSAELLSCSYDQFMDWLTYQFDEHMSMDNYGTYWHLDHVMPCASFDLTNDIELSKCFHWSNYRPCEGNENIEKGDKIDNDIINWHKLMIEEFQIENHYDMSKSLY